MDQVIAPGEWVMWRWAGGVAEGQVLEVSPNRAEIVSKGKKIVRNGTVSNPALIIMHSSGNKVLKLQSEVSTAKSDGLLS